MKACIISQSASQLLGWSIDRKVSRMVGHWVNKSVSFFAITAELHARSLANL